MACNIPIIGQLSPAKGKGKGLVYYSVTPTERASQFDL
jgi:hypothetical protein